MQVTHEYPLKVFKSKDKDTYSVGLSHKNKDGEWVNGYLEVKFRKDTEIDLDKKIYLKDGWLDFYIADTGKYTYSRVYLFINKFEYVEDVIKQETNDDLFSKAGTVVSDEIEIKDEDLPF